MDASGSLGTLFVELTANFANLHKGMSDAKEEVKKGAEGISSALESAKTVVEGFIAAFAVERIVEWGLHIIENLDHVKKFAAQIGMATDEMAGLQFAADKADMGAHFEMAMRKFSESARQAQVDGSAMQIIFRQLGVDPFGPLREGLFQVADDFKGSTDAVAKMGDAEALFGFRNAKLVTMLNGGSEGLREQIALYGELVGPVNEAAKQAEEFEEAIKDLKALATGLFLEVSKDVIPMFTDWMLAIRNNHAVIHDLGELINTVLVPSLQLASTGLQMTIVGLTELTSWGLKAMNIISPLGVALGKLALNKISAQVPGSEGFASAISKDMDNFKAVMDKLSKDLDTGLGKTLGSHTEVIKKGGDEMGAAVKGHVLPAVAQINALAEQLKKMTEEFNVTRLGIKKDIAGINGDDTTGKFLGYQQEVAVAQKQIDDLKKLNAIKTAMTTDQLKKQNELMKLYGDKQHALMVAQNVLVLDTMSKMGADLATIAEAFGGKQSALYKTMFAASKAFAIATASVKIAQGIAGAASEPWPLNLAAMASVVAATASIVSSIQAVKLEFGGAKALGGPVSGDKAYLVGERGPEMFLPGVSGSIVPNNRLAGGNVHVNIQNYGDTQPRVSERQDGDDRVIDVVLERVNKQIGSDIQNGKGPVNKALTSAFNLRRGRSQ